MKLMVFDMEGNENFYVGGSVTLDDKEVGTVVKVSINRVFCEIEDKAAAKLNEMVKLDGLSICPDKN